MYAGRVVEEAPRRGAVRAPAAIPTRRACWPASRLRARDREPAGERLRLDADPRQRAERAGAAARLLLRAALPLASRPASESAAAARRPDAGASQRAASGWQRTRAYDATTPLSCACRDSTKQFPARGRHACGRSTTSASTSAAARSSGLVGESGSGKTTVGPLRPAARSSRPAGAVIFDGVDLRRLSDGACARYRRRMQIVFQDPYSQPQSAPARRRHHRRGPRHARPRHAARRGADRIGELLATRRARPRARDAAIRTNSPAASASASASPARSPSSRNSSSPTSRSRRSTSRCRRRS